jgi:hypothetical protein
MATRRALAAFFALPVVASCSALLDFDALQKGTGGAAASGAAAGKAGTAGTGTSGGASGEGGASSGGTATGGKGGSSGTGGGGGEGGVACPAECFHDDPCLVDGCNEDGSCKTDHVVGLSLDGVDETIKTDHQFRVTMIGGDDAFFLSSLTATGTKPEVTFYRLDATKPELMPIGSIGGLAINGTGDPASAAGLVFQPVVGLVHAFVALTDRVGSAARVWHVVLGPQDTLPKPIPVGSLTDGYYATAYTYPPALMIGTQPYTAWINADHTVSLSDGSQDPPQQLAAAGNVTTLAMGATVDGMADIIYTTGGGGVFVERPGVAPLQLSECQPAPGDYLSISATDTTLPGFWVGSWTKSAPMMPPDPGYLTTNGRAFVCTADACGADMDPCAGGSENNLVRNPATVIAHRPGDPTALMELVQATPLLAADGDQVVASLYLGQQTIDFGAKPLQSKTVVTDVADPIVLATQPTSEGQKFAGPDWPAVAFVPPDKFAVTWTQPAAKAGGQDELRIQRYRMCLPPR